ncbi:MAG: hypothetical protein ACOCUH_00150, partial [Bacteriovoracia bacterium]
MIHKIWVFLLFSFICSLGFSQEAVFDSSCKKFAQKKDFVRGVITKSERTERYFIWEKITDEYQKVVREAPEHINRYQANDILDCQGSDYSNCFHFKAYCTEEIAIKGMDEEQQKWNDAAYNCTQKWYLEKYPQHCDWDFHKSLSYLEMNAAKLAKINSSKSPEVQQYFNNISDTFGKYADQLEELLLAKAKAESDKKQEELLKKNEKKAQEAFETCADVLAHEDDDIKGRDIENTILSAWDTECSNPHSSPNLNLTALADEMDAIADKLNFDLVGKELNEIALKNSSMAVWATYKRYKKPQINFQTVSGKQQAFAMICNNGETNNFCKNPRYKKILEDAFEAFQDKEKGIEFLDQNRQKFLEQEFNGLVDNMNKLCRGIADRIRGDYSVPTKDDSFEIDLNKYNPKSLYAKKLDLSNFTKYQPQSQSEADGILEQGRYFKNANSKQMNILKNQLLQTDFAHLLLTKDFQERIGFVNANPNDDGCIWGPHFMGRPSTDDFNKAKDDFFDLTLNELSQVADDEKILEEKRRKKRLDVVKNHLMTHPDTVVELLKKHPNNVEYSKALCSLIDDIYDRDKRRRVVEYSAIGAGAVAGVALSVTGIGSPAGASLLAATLGASGVEAGVNIAKIQEAKTLKSKFQTAAATGGMDDLNLAIESIKRSEKDIENSIDALKMVLIADVGFGVTGDVFGAMARSKRVSSISRFLKQSKNLDQLTPLEAQKLMKSLGKGIDNFTTHAKKIMSDKIKHFENLTHDELLQLGAIYSKIDPSDAQKLTRKLAALENPTQIKRFLADVDKALIADPKALFKVDGKINVKVIEDKVFLAKQDILPGKTITVNEKFAESHGILKKLPKKKGKSASFEDINENLIAVKKPNRNLLAQQKSLLLEKEFAEEIETAVKDIKDLIPDDLAVFQYRAKSAQS